MNRTFRPQFEELEQRLTPVASLSYNVAPDGLSHALTLRFNPATVRFEILDNGVLAASRSASSTTSIEINGANAQNEALTIQMPPTGSLPPVAFNGGLSGNDQIIASADLNFTLTNSSLTASNGTSVALSVTLIGVEAANLTGGPGNNRLDASSFSGTTTLNGGPGDDTLVGGFGVDTMVGSLGNDRLESLRGGNDQLQGGTGNDTYVIDPGSTATVSDDGGTDVLDLSQITGSGVQVTLGDSSGTVAEIANPNSTIIINGAIETLIATSQDDTITATGQTLFQTFFGGDGNDTLIDNSTAPQLTFNGGLGDDVYKLDPGSVIVVNDDGGRDTLDFSTHTTSGVTVTLGDSNGTATVAGGSVNVNGTIENVIGTDFDDTIIGNSVDNNFFGRAGNDHLDGGAGNDTVNGGPGDDTIIGGDGNDVMVGGGGNDTFDGGTGSDTYVVVPNSSFVFTDSGGIDTLDFSGAQRGISLNLGASGNQTLDADGDKVQLIGTFENVIGTPFEDHINGNNEDNVLVGGGGDDTLNGQAGRDMLIGGAGADRLLGSSGEDILIGGTTDFDNNVAALLAIQAEWSSARPYLTRVQNIRGDANVGPRLNGNFLLRATGPGQTVHDDGAVDTLTGGQQSDWFFVFTRDVVTDTNRGEQIDPVP